MRLAAEQKEREAKSAAEKEERGQKQRVKTNKQNAEGAGVVTGRKAGFEV